LPDLQDIHVTSSIGGTPSTSIEAERSYLAIKQVLLDLIRSGAILGLSTQLTIRWATASFHSVITLALDKTLVRFFDGPPYQWTYATYAA
jgi:hypothetical protein